MEKMEVSGYSMMSIAVGLIYILLGLLAYFLRNLHADLKQNIRDLHDLKLTTKVIETKSDGAIEKLADTMEIQMGHLTSNIAALTRTVEKHIEKNATQQVSRDKDWEK